MADVAVDVATPVDAEEDDELLKEYGEDGLEQEEEDASPATSSSTSSSASYPRGPRKPMPRSKHRPGDEQRQTNFMNMKIAMVLFVMFLISAIVVVAFKEDIFFNQEENTAIESDEIKINGLKETLKYNENKISQLTLTMEDKESELGRLKALLKKINNKKHG